MPDKKMTRNAEPCIATFKPLIQINGVCPPYLATYPEDLPLPPSNVLWKCMRFHSDEWNVYGGRSH